MKPIHTFAAKTATWMYEYLKPARDAIAVYRKEFWGYQRAFQACQLRCGPRLDGMAVKFATVSTRLCHAKICRQTRQGRRLGISAVISVGRNRRALPRNPGPVKVIQHPCFGCDTMSRHGRYVLASSVLRSRESCLTAWKARSPIALIYASLRVQQRKKALSRSPWGSDITSEASSGQKNRLAISCIFDSGRMCSTSTPIGRSRVSAITAKRPECVKLNSIFVVEARAGFPFKP